MAKHKSEGFTGKAKVKLEKKTENNPVINQKEARRIAARERLRVRECEAAIDRLQAEIDGYNADMQNPDITTDPGKMQELWEKMDSANKKMDELFEEWTILSEKLEGKSNE